MLNILVWNYEKQALEVKSHYYMLQRTMTFST